MTTRIGDNKTGPECELVSNAHHVAYFKRIVNGYFRNNVNSQFPGALPVSLERRDFHKLKTYEYSVTEKTDGIRYFMLITKHKDEQIALMIDRKYNFYKLFIYSENNIE